MEDNSNSSRVDDCGDAEEEDREQGTDDKKSTSSLCSAEGGTVCSNPPR